MVKKRENNFSKLRVKKKTGCCRVQNQGEKQENIG
jgi:hypothetical protein